LLLAVPAVYVVLKRRSKRKISQVSVTLWSVVGWAADLILPYAFVYNACSSSGIICALCCWDAMNRKQLDIQRQPSGIIAVGLMQNDM
jgi:uncharacterized membrane protein (GlpM family)